MNALEKYLFYKKFLFLVVVAFAWYMYLMHVLSKKKWKKKNERTTKDSNNNNKYRATTKLYFFLSFYNFTYKNYI